MKAANTCSVPASARMAHWRSATGGRMTAWRRRRRWRASSRGRISGGSNFRISTSTTTTTTRRRLRGGVFVDLFKVVRQGLLVGEPSYSLKYVEHLYRGHRGGDVATAGESMVF